MRQTVAWFVTAMVASMCGLQAWAGDGGPAGAEISDEALLNELMSVVDQGTEIATATRMNQDYVPGMVTVLEGETLRMLGVRSAWEALGQVPGVLTYPGPRAEPFILVRGLSFPFSSGNVKVMLNSIPMSRESSGVNSSLTRIPIEQVERIEFVRGPGTVLYGDFAFVGVVNIITRKEDSEGFARYEDGGNLTAGGRTAIGDAQGAGRLSLDFSAVDDGTPQASQALGGYDRRNYTIASYERRGLSLSTQRVQRELDPASASGVDERSTVYDARYGRELMDQLHANASMSLLQNRFDSQITTFDGDQWDFAGDLRWTGMKGHEWLLRGSYTDASIDHASQSLPVPGPPGAPPAFVGGPLLEDITQRYYGIGIQDQFSLAQDFTVTGGARYDHREDIDHARVTPQLAFAWQLAEGHLIKAQYTEGFRPPTFFELYTPAGKSTLDFETIATSELSYIFRKPNQVARATLFHSRLEDMIFGGRRGFSNAADGRAQGLELEWERQLTSRLKGQANLSYVDATTDRGNAGQQRDDAAAAHVLGNIACSYRLLPRLVLGGHLNYVGERQGPVDVAEEYRLALTLSAFDVLTRGLQLRAGVRNPFKDEQHTVITMPNNILVQEFDTRTAWMQLAYAF